MTQAHPVDCLERIAFGLEFLGESSRRISAYRNGARTLKKLGPQLARMYDSGELAQLAGIGSSTLKVVGAALAGEPVPKLLELEAKIAPGVWALRKLRGLGAKKLAVLHDELGIGSISELEYACNENRLVQLKGFGDKTQAKYLASIAELRDNAGRWRQDHGIAVARALETILACDDLRIAGGLGRAEETITELVLVAPAMSQAAMVAQFLEAAPGVTNVGTPTAVEYLGLPAVQIVVGGLDTTIVACPDVDRLGTHQLLATGPEDFVQALQLHAAKSGFVLGPAGLFRGAAPVPTPDEAAAFEALGLWPIPAERREFVLPIPRTAGSPATLVRQSDLCGALHNHTTASDGIHSLQEMQAAASALGWEYLGISEHSQTAGYAGGLSPEALLQQVDAVKGLNGGAGSRTQVLIGIESDILQLGELDYPSSVLGALDFVVASVHNRFRQLPDAATQRMRAAALNPWTDIIGHPTGRLLLGRGPTDFDMAALLDACAESGCAVELNSNPQRLDLNVRHLAMAKERGVLVSISPDAHSTVALGHVSYGIATARRAGLTPRDVLNCLPLTDLVQWLKQRKARAAEAGRT